MLNEKQRAHEVKMNGLREEIRNQQYKIEQMKRVNVETMYQIKGDTDNQINTIQRFQTENRQIVDEMTRDQNTKLVDYKGKLKTTMDANTNLSRLMSEKLQILKKKQEETANLRR